MNGEADNSRFVSMHVYMHLAFKELNSYYANLHKIHMHARDVLSLLLINSEFNFFFLIRLHVIDGERSKERNTSINVRRIFKMRNLLKRRARYVTEVNPE